MRCVPEMQRGMDDQRNCIPTSAWGGVIRLGAGRCIFIFSDARIFPMSDDDRMVDKSDSM